MKKRIVSLLLVLVMLVSLFPAPVRAAETDSNVDSGMTVEGTNGFGNLLSAELQAEYEEETRDNGNYSVLGLEITGNTAKVEYASMEEAVLVVALYTEDGLQLLTSGKTTVDPTEDIATVTIEGNMPEYFQASAYLADTYDFSPLCASYDTPMYTREMQELLASTVEDYDADRVLQLDEDKTTNFAVYAEDTIVIEEQPGVNTVASVNDETSTYVIENADESITSLREGDIFAYPYGDNEILIVKVASISVSGTTVTITGAELEMDEVFSHVKIEATGNTADMQVREDVVIDGVTFEGLVSDGAAPMAWDGSGNVSKTLQYSLSKELKDETDIDEFSVELSGSLGLKVKVNFSYYVSMARQFVELGTEVKLGVEVAVTGKVAAKLPLVPFGFSPIPGVYIDFNPNLTLEFTGKLSYNLSFSASASLTYENEKGFNTHMRAYVESKLDLEGAIFFGIDMNPNVGVLGGAVLDAELAMPIGVKLEAKFAPKDPGTGSTIHACKTCLDMDLYFEAELEIKLKFLKLDCLSKDKTFTFQAKLGDLYYSIDKNRLGKGECPYLEHRVTIQTCNASGIVPNVAVSIDNKVVGTTDGNGILTLYVPAGYRMFSAIIDGCIQYSYATVSNAGKIVLKGKGSSNNSSNSGGGIRDQIPGEVTDDGNIVSTGICGENATWALNKDGVLTISGTGKIYDFEYDGPLPWGKDIRSVVIKNGITSIGYYAFMGCSKLANVVIPKSVTNIGEFTFANCTSLTIIVIPDSVTSMESCAFYGCTALSGVVLPNRITSLSNGLFQNCTSLTSIKIPDSVTRIGSSAFSGCTRLTSIVIPDGVTRIMSDAFSGCTSLTYAAIPDGVTSIESTAFYKCSSLTSIVIPDGVTSIEYETFSGCTSLTSIVIPNSVTYIGRSAFSKCTRLTDVYYAGTTAQWNNIAISEYYNDNLTQARIHYNSTGLAAAAAEPLSEETVTEDIPNLDAVYGGEYDTEEFEDYTLKTASFTGLVPGEEYLLLALVDLDAEDPLAADNLLYITQAAAGEDGTLAFQYVQRTTAFVSYVMACGASNKNLNDAVITFPEMEANGELQVVDPAVTYDGKTLTEGEDYTILGDVSFTEAGDYACYIRGIHSYTGLVTCTYTVTGDSETPPIEESTPTAPPVEETKPTEPEETKPQPKPTEPEATKPTEPEETKPQPKPTEPEGTKPTEPDEPKYENPFEDVFEADYYYDPVLWAVNEGITNGMDATHFAPAGTCTRAQIVTFLWRANGSPASGGANPFTDVPADAWYTDAVLWAVENGITTGTSATTFSPDAGCTRGQVATFLWRSQGQPSVNGENIFTDIAPGAYYYDAVLWAVANGITNGMGEGLFAPDATCTRGQIVTFLYRAMA